MDASPLFASSASFLLSHFSCSNPLHPLLHSPRPAFPGYKCSFLYFFSRNLVSTTIFHTREPVLVAKRIQQFNRQPTCKSHHVIKCTNQVCGATGKGTYLALINEDKSNNGESTFSAKTQPRPFHNAFWRFLRPHTVRGTVIGTTALVTRALLENVNLINWLLLPKALSGLLALICGNGYIVGINQIYDVDIDKVNKPFLPIAAGDLSMSAAWRLVLGLAAIGIGIVATNFGSLITTLYMLGLLLGAMYSVPPLRLKRFPAAAFFVIAMVRGFLLNFGVYYATRASLGLSFQWSPPVAFITIFVTMFAVVIAITKDLPDVEGDVKYNISTFATKLGVRNIALLGSGLLLANYAGAIAFASRMPQFFRPGFMALWHAILAATLVYQTWLLDSSKYTKEAIASFYRFIWNLFYAEYAMFPFL